jgi:hypothetical protein
MEDKEILEGLKSSSPYGFIANNYCEMSKEQLKDIILELLGQFNGQVYEGIINELIEGLTECRGWEE